jgi:NADH-quinone oxidoreductase subunit C
MMQIAKPLDPVEALNGAHPNVVQDTHQFRNETTIIVAPKDVVAAARYLRDTPGLHYNYLSDISAVDYYPEYNRPGRFGVSYHLYSMLHSRRIRLKVFVQEDETVVPTMTVLWSAANWLEREIYDMMGIEFEGHPDMRRVLMPDDWNGHPLRRDYPLGYETVMFSFNYDQISKHKPYAKE